MMLCEGNGGARYTHKYIHYKLTSLEGLTKNSPNVRILGMEGDHQNQFCRMLGLKNADATLKSSSFHR